MKKLTRFSLALALLFNILFTTKSFAQNDSCPVVAKISPSATDSVLPANTQVMFTSVSENATSYRWLYQGLISGISNTQWNYGTAVGLQTIGLVATNGTCSDTTSVVYFSPGTPHNINTSLLANYGYSRTNEYATTISGTADGSGDPS